MSCTYLGAARFSVFEVALQHEHTRLVYLHIRHGGLQVQVCVWLDQLRKKEEGMFSELEDEHERKQRSIGIG